MPIPASLKSFLWYALKILLVASVYAILARVSLLFQFQFSNASPVWAPSGFAFAILILIGYRYAPAIWLGAFVSNLAIFLLNDTASFLLAAQLSVAIALGNSLEALAGAYLASKIITGFSRENILQKTEHIFQLLFIAMLMCLISSAIGLSTLAAGEIISPAQYFVVWLTWWLGDVSGVIVLSPLILSWASAFRHPPVLLPSTGKRKAEVIFLYITVFAASGIIFDNWLPSLTFFKWAFWIIPVLVWAAIRFNQRETITALVLCATIAIWGTVAGHGPFFNLSLNDALITVQAFICTLIITMLILNASLGERKKAEATLLEARNQLEQNVQTRTAQLEDRNRFAETIFDSVEELMVVIDKDCNYVSLNRKMEEVFGIKRSKVIGRNVLEVYPALKNTETYVSLLQSLEGKPIHKISYHSKIVNRYFENFYIPLKNERQEIYGVLVIGHDNTMLVESAKKLERSEEKMRLSEQKFRGLLENAPDAMVIVNRSGVIELVNAQTEKFFGYDKAELIGKEVEILIPGQFHAIHSVHREKYFNHPKVRGMGPELELSGRRKNGTEFPIEISLSPLKTPNVMLVSASIRDITKRKQTESELKNRSEEIVQMNKDLQKMNRELQTFVYAAGHDLQEPLRKISIFASHILERESASLSDSGKDSFARIQKGVSRMQQLIEDLLAYSRTSTSEKHFEKTDLNILVEQVKSELHEKITATQTTIEARQLPEMNIIPFQFHQLFTNMISNSIKFSRPGTPPRIQIVGHMVEGGLIHGTKDLGAKRYHRLTVSDNGIGFQMEHSERIFELFQRLHGRSEFEGSGIGLSICKKIVENHNGIITATGEPEIGATFHIYIPAADLPL